MAVTSFQDFNMADADREWDGGLSRQTDTQGLTLKTNPTRSIATLMFRYDADNKDNFTAYKLLICDVVNGKALAVPRGVMAAGGIMQGARGGVDIPESDAGPSGRDHLAKYHRKMDRTPPLGRPTTAARIVPAKLCRRLPLLAWSGGRDSPDTPAATGGEFIRCRGGRRPSSGAFGRVAHMTGVTRLPASTEQCELRRVCSVGRPPQKDCCSESTFFAGRIHRDKIIEDGAPALPVLTYHVPGTVGSDYPGRRR